MLELIVERWTGFDGSVDYRWSLWQDGKRLQMGGPHASADASEREATEYCHKSFKRTPDRVERL